MKNLWKLTKKGFIIRNFSTVAFERASPPCSSRKTKMCGWQLNSYGGLEQLKLTNNIDIPVIKSTDEILVKVQAAGVNPIDVLIAGGYGSSLLNLFRGNRKNNTEFPLILGREFCGTVIQKGLGCHSKLKFGDSVWGVVPLNRNGSHAEYVVVTESCVSEKPKDLSATHAAGTLYVGLTALSGIFLTGQLGGLTGALGCNYGSARRKRVLVIGASGGLGSTVVQILKAVGAYVIASCSTNAVPIVTELGADHVIDYMNLEQISEFTFLGPYDLIIDCAGKGAKYANAFDWSFKSYVTFSSPLLRNIDQHGLGFGMIRNMVDIFEDNSNAFAGRNGSVKWAYFMPSQKGILFLKQLVEDKKLQPLVHSIHSFESGLDAYTTVSKGHLRGKVIIDLEEN